MAMTFSPRLLLADEPTSALDVTTQAQIVRQMMELREAYQTSILIVTHNLGLAAYMSDRLIVMKNGKTVDAGGQGNDSFASSQRVYKAAFKGCSGNGGETFCPHDRKTEEKERAILEARHVTKEYPAPGGRTLKALRRHQPCGGSRENPGNRRRERMREIHFCKDARPNGRAHCRGDSV